MVSPSVPTVQPLNMQGHDSQVVPALLKKMQGQ